MKEQTLFTPPPADGDLTDRQRFVLAALRSPHSEEGIDHVTVGAMLHRWQGKHGLDDPCDFCDSAGLEVLRALRRRNLVVRRRRTGLWQALDKQHDPQLGEVPY